MKGAVVEKPTRTAGTLSDGPEVKAGVMVGTPGYETIRRSSKPSSNSTILVDVQRPSDVHVDRELGRRAGFQARKGEPANRAAQKELFLEL
jgi:hypothetical protein